MSNVTYLLQRSYASSCLYVMKLKAFAPCDVADELNKYNEVDPKNWTTG